MHENLSDRRQFIKGLGGIFITAVVPQIIIPKYTHSIVPKKVSYIPLFDWVAYDLNIASNLLVPPYFHDGIDGITSKSYIIRRFIEERKIRGLPVPNLIHLDIPND